MNQIEQQVSAGTLKLGTHLPAERALASELRIHFNIVAGAYRLLDDAGVYPTRGRGTYISMKPLQKVEKKHPEETLEALARRHKRGAQWKNTSVSGFLTQEIAPSIPPDPTVLRLLFFLPLFLIELTTISLMFFSPLFKVSKFTLYSLAGMFLVFAIWGFLSFSFAYTTEFLIINVVAKALAFLVAVTLFLPQEIEGSKLPSGLS